MAGCGLPQLLLAVALSAICLLQPAPAIALKVTVRALAEECFTATLTEERRLAAKSVNEKLTLNGGFLVMTPGRIVDARVNAPSGEEMWSMKRVSEEKKFELVLGSEPDVGEYRLCLKSVRHAREVRVDVPYFLISHAVQESANSIMSPMEGRVESAAQHVHLQEVHKGVQRVRELLKSLVGEAKYLKKRLNRHAKTTASTNSRTLSWTSIEVAVLVSVALLQVFIYHRMFNKAETKPGWR
mmetsp:Transcript_35467/g.89431  ORF Transcript_35467/g.89431 Transcript_35467/m.89431 type:complete len:241 (-) Transcript_35467:13-735(-)